VSSHFDHATPGNKLLVPKFNFFPTHHSKKMHFVVVSFQERVSAPVNNANVLANQVLELRFEDSKMRAGDPNQNKRNLTRGNYSCSPLVSHEREKKANIRKLKPSNNCVQRNPELSRN